MPKGSRVRDRAGDTSRTPPGFSIVYSHIIHGVRYESHENRVTAKSISEQKILWIAELPVDVRNTNSDEIEADVQWNIISILRIGEDGRLLVRFKKGESFALDRKTGEWQHYLTAPTGDSQ